MARIFGKVEQREEILTDGETSNSYLYVFTTEDLTLSTDGLVGNRSCVLRTKSGSDGTSGIYKYIGAGSWNKIYPQTVSVGSNPAWTIDKMWKRLTSDSIILFWKSSEATDWDHDVIVKKRGSAPTSSTDGEVIGCSYVRDQYYNDITNASDNKPGFVAFLADGDDDYYFRVFAVTTSGAETASPNYMTTAITWNDISSAAINNRHKKLFRVGDIFPMPEHEELGQLYAQIIGLNHSTDQRITFMTTTVLGNMSFDNKELMYAKTFDSFFKQNKRYFVYEGGSYKEFNLTLNGFDVGDPIPPERYWNGGTHSKLLYELNKSIRFFVNATNSAFETQATIYAGSSDWTSSNLRAWLTQERGTGTNYGITGVTESTSPTTWTNNVNGWFVASQGAYHDLAPGSSQSATYIEKPRFQDGFEADWLNMLAAVKTTTITDGYVYRYVRSENNLDDLLKNNIVSNDTDHPGAVTVKDNKFWIPSFEEIYGKRPVTGFNGTINTLGIENTHEGHQFDLFVDNREARVKLGPDGQPMKWYLRSCDPTTVSRIYYVDNALPDSDDNSLIDLTCTAHRSTISGEPKIGPVVCFAI